MQNFIDRSASPNYTALLSFATPAVLAILLLAIKTHPAYAGSAPDVPAPTCVKWCGNETESSGSTPSRKPSKSTHTPMPTIDVGAMMDAAQARKNKAKKAEIAAAKAAEAARLQQEAKQRAALQAQQAEEHKAILSMGDELKGVTIKAPNTITLKPVPPAARSARSQLDCAASIKPDTDHSDPGAESWENYTGNCKPASPSIPAVPAPTRVESQSDQLAKLLDGLMHQITQKRETLTQMDQEIAAREQEVTQESLKIVSPDKPESDALRRAREALEKARADRARTADELAKLEQQERAAKNKPSTSY